MAKAAFGPPLRAGEFERSLMAEPLLLVQLFQLSAEPGELSFTFVDLIAQAAATADAAERTQTLQPLSRLVQCACRGDAFLRERCVPVVQVAALQGEPLAVGQGPPSAHGVEGERFGGRTAERLGEPVDIPLGSPDALLAENGVSRVSALNSSV